MPQGNNARRGSTALDEVRSTPLELVKASTVTIDGEDVFVGKLGLNQLVAIARTAGQMIARGRQEEFRQAAERAREGVTDAADVVTMLSLLDAASISKLIGIVVQRDEEWVGKHVDLLALLEIIDAVLEHNDWPQLQQAFFRLGRRFQSAQN